ncbi:helix-turn-helix domain-containing protein [Mucilaginibacter paludis]|uniref:Helix-turn-helix domain protein n=1 Tax=Mucilaginibacter paludis DSM 18603 TaxID=714943 RepID=H1YEG4_9SPHI|nr:helix-turn-helix domain-containing protein [Mucilaginibacter paludis]EHQ27198.1 helix-turn-helix domain protein [Mucilaginibacter paludis DSM 18603]
MERIENNSDYYIALSKIESFIARGFDNLSVKETKELETLSLLVEQFETDKYPMPMQASITDVLQNIMHEKKMNKSQLSAFLEIPNSTLSSILNGKKKINMGIAKKLHSKLHIDGNLILETV